MPVLYEQVMLFYFCCCGRVGWGGPRERQKAKIVKGVRVKKVWEPLCKLTESCKLAVFNTLPVWRQISHTHNMCTDTTTGQSRKERFA